MKSKSQNSHRFPVPLGRIAVVQVIAVTCLILLILSPTLAVFFLMGVNFADFTWVSDFSSLAFFAFGIAILIDTAMYIYAMGDARRSVAKFLKESNPRDLIESEMAQPDQPGELAIRMTSEFLKAKTGICIGFALVNTFVIGLLVVDPTFLNLIFCAFCWMLYFFNFPTPNRVRRWIHSILLRHRSLLESDLRTNQRIETKISKS